MNKFDTQTNPTVELQKVVYEAPCIETVLSAEELEREVAYAGTIGVGAQISLRVGVGVGGVGTVGGGASGGGGITVGK